MMMWIGSASDAGWGIMRESLRISKRDQNTGDPSRKDERSTLDFSLL
jgi:hypothetical protein